MVELLRDGKRIKKKVSLIERDAQQAEVEPEEPEAESGIEWLGIRYQELTRQTRAAHGLPDDLEGIWVTQVDPTSQLYNQNLRAGQGVFSIITEVNGQQIQSAEELEETIAAAKSGSRLKIYVQQFFSGGPGGELRSTPLVMFPRVP